MVPMRVEVSYSHGQPNLIQGDHAVYDLYCVDSCQLIDTSPRDEDAAFAARRDIARRRAAGEPRDDAMVWSLVRHHERETYAVSVRGGRDGGVHHGRLLRVGSGGWWLILGDADPE